MAIGRRDFLRGASACAVAAVVPVPVLADEMVVTAKFWIGHRPIFQGAVGIYQGVVLRDMNRETYDLVGEAKRLAATCHPRIQSYGAVASSILEGIEFDGR